MYFGKYHHQIDEKNRIRIPSKLKDIVGVNPFIMPGPNKSLIVLREDEAKQILDEQFGKISIFDSTEKSLALRKLSSNTVHTEEDKQGRMILPQGLMEYAKIKDKKSGETNRNIVIIGAYKKIEIWSGAIWEEYAKEDEEEFDDKMFELISG